MMQRQKTWSRRSPITKSSACVSACSWNLRSAPRTQKPSHLSRLTRCPPMKPPAPQTSAVFIADDLNSALRSNLALIPQAGRPSKATFSDGPGGDQHVPAKAALESSEHPFRHGPEPRLHFVLVTNVLLNHVGE